MQYFPHQLKEKLVKALDKDNNVADVQGVLDVISLLEKCTLTREDLEQTRIGKLVNELRKKTDNRDVAKRAKNLVKRWQALISGPAPAVNGGGIAGQPVGGGAGGPCSKPASPALSRLSPASTGSSKPVSPALQRLSPKTSAGLSPNLPPTCPKLSSQKQVTALNGRASVSPLLRTGSATCAIAGQTVSPALSGSSMSASPRLPPNHVSHTSNHLPGQSYAPAQNAAESKTKQVKTNSNGSVGQMLSKTNAANKKRRRTPDPNSPNEIPSKKQLVDSDHLDQNGVGSPHSHVNNSSSADSTKLKRISSTPDIVNGIISDKYSGHHGKAVYTPVAKPSGNKASTQDTRNDWGRVDSPGLSSLHSGGSTSPCTPSTGKSKQDQIKPGLSAKRNVNLLLKTPEQSVERPDKSGSSCKTPKKKKVPTATLR